MSRALAVTRMHFVDRRTLFGAPAGILATIVAINAVVWMFVARGGRETGGAVSVYCFVLAIALLSVVRGLPFVLGMGVSRRAFALGTLWAAGLLALVFGAAMTALSMIERATDGWGAGGHLFYFSWMDSSGPLGWWLVLTMPFVTVFAMGSAAGSIYLRWRMPGMFVTALATILLGGGVAILVTSQHAWGSLADWIVGRTPFEVVGLALAAVVVFGAVAWEALRKTAL